MGETAPCGHFAIVNVLYTLIEGVDSCVHGVLHPPAAGEHLPLRHNQVGQVY
jgi:hypothetical protein